MKGGKIKIMLQKLKYIPILAIGIFLSLFFTTDVFASATVSDFYYDGAKIRYQRYVPYNGKTMYDKMEYYENNGIPAYCIEPGVKAGTGEVYTGTSDWSATGLSQEKINKISMIAYYGYQYPGHSDLKYYLAAQGMIWDIILDVPAGRETNFDKNDNKYNILDISSEKATIQNLINDHGNLPSFAYDTKDTSIGQNISYTDSKNILGNFQVGSCTNCNARIDGNTLNVTPNDTGSYSVELIRKYDVHNRDLVYFVSGTYQNQIIPGNIDPIRFYVSGNSYGGQVAIKKFDSKTNSCKTSSADARLSGAVYGIYKENGELVNQLTIGDDCSAKSERNLALGNYYIKEIKAPIGYELDVDKYAFSVTAESAKNLITIVVKDNIHETNLVINKTYLTENGVEAEVGATFDIILKSTNERVATITIDESATGHATIPYGTYIIRQTKGKDNYHFSSDREIVVNENSKRNTYITLLNVPYALKVKAVKTDENGNQILMKGIRFKIYDVTNNKYICQNITYPTSQTICEFETDENGEFITPYPLMPSTYRLEEVDQKINGYLWNSNPLEFVIDENTRYETDDNGEKMIVLNFENQEVKGQIEIHKTGEKVIYENNTFTYQSIPLPDVLFGLYDETGKLVGKYKTDVNGYLKIENLKLGKYVLKELETNKNYVLDTKEYSFELKYKDQYTAVVNKTFNLKNYLKKGNLEFTKEDIATEKGIPNTKIEIHDVLNDNIIFSGLTDKDGHIIIENLYVGKFYIVEKEPATGYVLNESKVYFEIKEDGKIVKANMTNRKIKSKIHFHKTNENDVPLEGVKVGLYDEKGKLLGTYYTDENGIIELELEYGNYYLKEIETIEGYVLNNQKIEIQVKTDGEVINKELTNRKIKSKIHFHKTNENDVPLEGVKVGLYNEKGKLLDTYLTDENGDIELELEYGKYYLQELETIEGYVLNDKKIEIPVKTDGEVIEKELTNRNIKSKIHFHKTNESDDPLEGVKVGLYDENDKLLETYYTDEYGNIELELEYGTYYLQEIETIEGFVLNNEKLEIQVKSDGEVIENNLINRKIKGSLTFKKVDENGNPLAGVQINLYKEDGSLINTFTTDENGIIFIPDLEYGNYYIKEISTVDGYSLSDEIISFSIIDDGVNVDTSMINVLLPQTGLNDYSKIISISLLSLGMAFLTVIKRKEKRKIDS